MIQSQDMYRARCQQESDWAFEEQARGKSNEGIVTVTADPNVRQARKAVADEHFQNANKHWQKGREAVADGHKGDCEECLGRLGVRLCPLLSETKVTIGDLYARLTENERDRVRKVYKGGGVKKSASITEKIGILTSDIDEADFARYLIPPTPEEASARKKTSCPHLSGIIPLGGLDMELARGVDPEVLIALGLGTDTPNSLSNGALQSDQAMASYLDPNHVSDDGIMKIALVD